MSIKTKQVLRNKGNAKYSQVLTFKNIDIKTLKQYIKAIAKVV